MIKESIVYIMILLLDYKVINVFCLEKLLFFVKLQALGKRGREKTGVTDFKII